jgi:hypothetical protein
MYAAESTLTESKECPANWFDTSKAIVWPLHDANQQAYIVSVCNHLHILVPFYATSVLSSLLTMSTSFLIPATNGGSSHHALNANASSSGNAPPPGEDPCWLMQTPECTPKWWKCASRWLVLVCLMQSLTFKPLLSIWLLLTQAPCSSLMILPLSLLTPLMKFQKITKATILP